MDYIHNSYLTIAEVSEANLNYLTKGHKHFGGRRFGTHSPVFSDLESCTVPLDHTCYKYIFTLFFLSPSVFQLSYDVLQMVLAGGLGVSLVSSLFFMMCTKFNANRIYGFYLYALYLGFLVIALLTESEVLTWWSIRSEVQFLRLIGSASLLQFNAARIYGFYSFAVCVA